MVGVGVAEAAPGFEVVSQKQMAPMIERVYKMLQVMV